MHDTERPVPLVESVARRDAVPVGLAARAERLVRDEMARSLRIGASEIAGWSSQQWTFSQRQRHPLYDPGRRREREAVRAFLDAACGSLALPRPEVRDVEAVATGTWRLWERSTEEPDWTAASSLARTYGDRIAYTTCGAWPR